MLNRPQDPLSSFAWLFLSAAFAQFASEMNFSLSYLQQQLASRWGTIADQLDWIELDSSVTRVVKTGEAAAAQQGQRDSSKREDHARAASSPDQAGKPTRTGDESKSKQSQEEPKTHLIKITVQTFNVNKKTFRVYLSIYKTSLNLSLL